MKLLGLLGKLKVCKPQNTEYIKFSSIYQIITIFFVFNFSIRTSNIVRIRILDPKCSICILVLFMSNFY